MKKTVFFIVGLLVIALFINSCKKEEEIANGAKDFEGSYRTEDNCSNTRGNVYIVTIKENPSNPDQILLYNYYNFGVGKFVTADINGNSINIFPQAYSNTTVSGTGLLSGNNISLNYEVDDGSGIIDSCDANLFRQ